MRILYFAVLAVAFAGTSCALLERKSDSKENAQVADEKPAKAEAQKASTQGPVPTAPSDPPPAEARASKKTADAESAAHKSSPAEADSPPESEPEIARITPRPGPARLHDLPPQNDGQRIQMLEERTRDIHEQLEAMKNALDRLIQQQGSPRKVSAPALTPAAPHPAADSDIGVPAEPKPVRKGDPEAGFVRDQAIQNYRAALYLYKAEKFPESILAFASFVDRYPDHPLAGNAQFQIGESYYKQREYRLAAQEFDKVLTSYDRSSSIPQTLKRLADCKDQLKQKEEADRYRTTLNTLFPNSPSNPHERGALMPVVSPATASRTKAGPQLDAPPEANEVEVNSDPDGVKYDPHWGTQ